MWLWMEHSHMSTRNPVAGALPLATPSEERNVKPIRDRQGAISAGPTVNLLADKHRRAQSHTSGSQLDDLMRCGDCPPDWTDHWEQKGPADNVSLVGPSSQSVSQSPRRLLPPTESSVLPTARFRRRGFRPTSPDFPGQDLIDHLSHLQRPVGGGGLVRRQGSARA